MLPRSVDYLFLNVYRALMTLKDIRSLRDRSPKHPADTAERSGKALPLYVAQVLKRISS